MRVGATGVSRFRVGKLLSKILLTGGAVVLAAAAGCDGGGPPARLLVEGVRVIDGTGAPPRTDATIVIEGSRITRIAPSSEVEPSAGDRRIDASGSYAIPGLWDMHVHLSKAKAEALPVLLALGVTGVRDMGGDLEEIRGFQERIRRGETAGPRIVTPGPSLEAPATLDRVRAQDSRESWWRTRVPVPDTASARRVVDSLIALDVDFIKVRESVSTEVYRAIVAAARARGARVASHPPADLDPLEAARLGVGSFEHASYPYPLDTVPARRARILEAWRQSGVHLVPTLAAWQTHTMDPDSLEALVRDTWGVRDPRRRLLSDHLTREWAEDLRRLGPRTPGYYRGFQGFLDRTYSDLGAMREAGIPVMPGSDLAGLGLFPGWALHTELENLVRHVGMSPMEAIESATRVPAEFLSMVDSLGTLEPGKLADLVLLERNPLEDIRHTREISAVVTNGRYLDGRDLHRLLGGLGGSTRGDLVLRVRGGGT